ncbi:hypothetical protein [Mucilaginibacter glaciei]|uniref:Uncharacterized protein n=1 Tax=Mucilaginibacter glaciei TaxID=2772109 RepID=A0A926NKW5_9SPHI|nr:hypothetical protein [Mucilaginibacter glaciei]MBD1391516.1 hypothetical protein [Mucilaginibacter glaciei]
MDIHRLQNILQNLQYRKEAFIIAIILVAVLMFLNYKIIPALVGNSPRAYSILQGIINFLLFLVCGIIVIGAALLWLVGNRPNV